MRFWGSINYIITPWIIGHWMRVEVSRLFIYCYAAFLLLTIVSTWGLPRLRDQAVHAMWSSFRQVVGRKPLVCFFC
ncbi:hypothetical protein [Thermobaculum terrenum]|uniref:hypothetical protein n=1 Tax=Thermobaculum terrenum TaxID=166501 RepID=UPI0030B98F42